jgi:hypothetical protein
MRYCFRPVGCAAADYRFARTDVAELTSALATLRRFAGDAVRRSYLVRGRSLPRFGILDARDRKATFPITPTKPNARLQSMLDVLPRSHVAAIGRRDPGAYARDDWRDVERAQPHSGGEGIGVSDCRCGCDRHPM